MLAIEVVVVVVVGIDSFKSQKELQSECDKTCLWGNGKQAVPPSPANKVPRQVNNGGNPDRAVSHRLFSYHGFLTPHLQDKPTVGILIIVGRNRYLNVPIQTCKFQPMFPNSCFCSLCQLQPMYLERSNFITRLPPARTSSKEGRAR